MINYWPTENLNIYLNLQNRVPARMALAAAAARGSDNPLAHDETPKTAQLELNFRDRQLLELLENILNLDDLSDNVVMSDFTMDYFFAQLHQYLAKTKPNSNPHPSAPTP